MTVLKDLFNKLKDGLTGGGSGGGEDDAAPEVNERMARITSGAAGGFGSVRKPIQNLTGGRKSMSLEQIRGVRHEVQRQKEETAGRAAVEKVRAKLGRVRLEKLAALPRTFAPAAVTAFHEEFSDVTPEQLATLEKLVPGLDRDLCADLAIANPWGPEVKQQIVAAIPEAKRAELAPAVELLASLPQLSREGVLRISRAAQTKPLAAMLAELRGFPLEDIKAAAHGLANFADADARKLTKGPEAKPDPKAAAKPTVKKPFDQKG